LTVKLDAVSFCGTQRECVSNGDYVTIQAGIHGKRTFFFQGAMDNSENGKTSEKPERSTFSSGNVNGDGICDLKDVFMPHWKY